MLYLQSSYSMLKSMIHLEELVRAAVDNNYEFIALSDEQLYGAYDLFLLAKEYNIKPILGLKIDVTSPDETSFLVYAKNDIGYQNLLSLSLLKEEKTKISIENLLNHQKGLIFVTAGYDSIIDQTAIFGNKDSILSYLNKYKNYFDDFFVGLSKNYKIQEENSFDFIYEICTKNDINIVPLHKSLYLSKEDKNIYDIFARIENNLNANDNYDFHLLSASEIENYYHQKDEVFKGLSLFKNLINFNLNFPKFNLPKFKDEENFDSRKYLTNLARLGLKKRLENLKFKNYQLYLERLNYELNIILGKKFEDYFLIVYDFVRYAKQNHILVGPGRGSAAGSLVSYCLGITNIDPIYHGLMFERFLNPVRSSMPDIDIDFPDNKRDDVINYVRRKYGDNHIMSISTFTSLGLKSSIRDIARVLKIPASRVTGIVNSIVEEKFDKSDSDILKILDVAKKIEGLYRQTGTHAAGIILATEDLKKIIPLKKGAFDFYQSQFEAKTLEKLGLNKIDFLGIRNLTIISDILNMLKLKNINIDINKIPLNDQKTFMLLQKGATTGIFQLESDGMRNVLRKLKPNKFDEISATLALYRPGPMANIDEYILRRNGKKFDYYHPDLKNSLKSTYGIIVYQEQVMQVAQEFAGYNLFDADILRSIISKKKVEELEKERIKFIKSSIKNNKDEKLANKIYDYILKFGDYGFNKSHSVSYAMVAYQMTYLKANYYKEFMVCLLNSVIGNEKLINQYINEIRFEKIKVLPPDLNASALVFKIVNGDILMPLTQIKGIGTKVASEIIKERDNKIFANYLDVKSKLAKVVSQKQFENLIYAGSLDFLGLNQKTLIENMDFSTIGMEVAFKDFKMEIVDDFSFSAKLKQEKEVLGTNLKYNLKNLKNKENNLFLPSEIDENFKLQNFNILAMVLNIKIVRLKNNKEITFLEVGDGISNLEITVFDESFDSKTKDKIFKFNLRKNLYKGKKTYILVKMSDFDQAN